MRIFLLILSVMFVGNVVFGMDNDKFQTQKEMNEVAKKEFEKSDNELNELYNLLLKSLSGENKQKLVNAQKAWVKYRDAHCQAVTDLYQGGSAFYLIKYSCLKEITEQRIVVLKSAYQERLERQ